VAKSKSRQVTGSPTRVKTAFCLTQGANQKLGAASMAEGRKRSDIVEILINRYLSGYVVSVRGGGIWQFNGSASSESQPDIAPPPAARERQVLTVRWAGMGQVGACRSFRAPLAAGQGWPPCWSS